MRKRLLLKTVLQVLTDLWDFLKERKKWWLAPMILAMILVGLLIFLTESSPVAPFIYTLF